MKSLLEPKFSPLFLILAIVVVFAIEGLTMYWWTDHMKEMTFQNPFPDIAVAKRLDKPIPNAYLKKYDFSVDWFTMNIPVWEKVLSPYKGMANVHYLEVGVAEGRSVIWMLENILTDPSAKVTAIDTFPGSLKDKFLANVELSGSSEKVTTIKNYSQLALRNLPFESFDIIYIDGSHAKNDVLEDAVLSWRLLKQGGILIFDDYRYIGFNYENFSDTDYFPKEAIDVFVHCFDEYFDVVHNEYQLILRRTDKKI